jgi:hypothetical protein
VEGELESEAAKRVRRVWVLGAPVELENLLPVSIVPLFWKFRQQGWMNRKVHSNHYQALVWVLVSVKGCGKRSLSRSLEWSERRNGNNWLNRALQCLHPTPRGFNDLPVVWLLLPKFSSYLIWGIWPDTLLYSLPPILVHGDGLPLVMNFPSAGCKVLLSLSVCSVSFSVAFYVCDLLYSLLRLSFGKQDQLPTPTWQWVTLAQSVQASGGIQPQPSRFGPDEISAAAAAARFTCQYGSRNGSRPLTVRIINVATTICTSSSCSCIICSSFPICCTGLPAT